MTVTGFRAPARLLDAIDAAAAARFSNRSEYIRQAVLARMELDGVDVASLSAAQPLSEAQTSVEQYALVDGARIVKVAGPGPKPDAGTYGNVPGEWLPVFSVDASPFDPAMHYRLAPHYELDGGRVLRVYPVILKSED